MSIAAFVFADQNKCRTLIYSGQNNHAWRETTPLIKQILENHGIAVDVTEKPDQVTTELLADYDVIISNWNNFAQKKSKQAALDWPETVKKAFLEFIKNGGGHVTVHAGGCSFYKWSEYHKIAASWTLGKTYHKKIHAFRMKSNPDQKDHPIVQGISTFWTKDELWNSAGIPKGSTTLMTALSSEKSGGTGKEEPLEKRN
jgi:type 1 glutamine amidotransferase